MVIITVLEGSIHSTLFWLAAHPSFIIFLVCLWGTESYEGFQCFLVCFPKYHISLLPNLLCLYLSISFHPPLSFLPSSQLFNSSQHSTISISSCLYHLYCYISTTLDTEVLGIKENCDKLGSLCCHSPFSICGPRTHEGREGRMWWRSRGSWTRP